MSKIDHFRMLLAGLVAAGFLWLLGGCSGMRGVPAPAAFAAAPYAELRLGGEPGFRYPPQSLCALKPGRTVGFFRTPEGDLKVLACRVPVSLPVTISGGSAAISRSRDQAALHSTRTQTVLSSQVERGRLSTSTAETVLSRNAASGMSRSVGADLAVRSARQSGGMLVAHSNVAMRNAQREGVFNSSDDTAGTAPRGAPAEPNAGQTATASETSETAGREKGPAPQPGAAWEETADAGAHALRPELAAETGDKTAPAHGVPLGATGKRPAAPPEAELAALLEDAEAGGGYYDRTGARIPARAVSVPQEQHTAFVAALQGSRRLDEILLDTPRSGHARGAERPPATAGCGITMLVGAGGKGAVHHGQQIPISVVLRNAGSQTIHGILLLQQLPAHASFVRFADAAAPANGVLQYFSRDDELLVWKLCRPLRPGELFKARAVLQLDPWRVGKPRRLRRAPAVPAEPPDP